MTLRCLQPHSVAHQDISQPRAYSSASVCRQHGARDVWGTSRRSQGQWQLMGRKVSGYRLQSFVSFSEKAWNAICAMALRIPLVLSSHMSMLSVIFALWDVFGVFTNKWLNVLLQEFLKKAHSVALGITTALFSNIKSAHAITKDLFSVKSLVLFIKQ